MEFRPNSKICRVERARKFFQNENIELVKIKNIAPKQIKKVNTIINRFKDFTEVILYKKHFDVMYGSDDYELVDTTTGEILIKRQRNFIEQNGVLIPQHDGATLEALEKSLTNSHRRSKDMFLGFAYSNSWDYWCTYTVSVKEHAHTDEDTKYYWKLFREKLQYYFPNIEILAVPERHKRNKNIHFHALIGGVNIDRKLIGAIHPRTGEPLLDKGRRVYNLPLWDKGFTRIIKLPKDHTNQAMVTNYIAKYMTKFGEVGYNKKQYYRTQNLDFKHKHLSFTHNPHEWLDEVRLDHFMVHKENERMIVLRRLHHKN